MVWLFPVDSVIASNDSSLSIVMALPVLHLTTLNKLFPQTHVHHHHNIKEEVLPCTMLDSAGVTETYINLLVPPSLVTTQSRFWLDTELQRRLEVQKGRPHGGRDSNGAPKYRNLEVREEKGDFT